MDEWHIRKTKIKTNAVEGCWVVTFCLNGLHLSSFRVCVYVCMYLGPIDKFSTAPILLLLLMCIHYSSPKLDSSCTNLTVKTKVRQWVLNHLVWFGLFCFSNCQIQRGRMHFVLDNS